MMRGRGRLWVGGVLHAVLSRVDEGEDMVFGAFQDAFEDGQVGDDAAGVEVLEAIEDDLVAVGGDFEIAVARVDGASDELSIVSLPVQLDEDKAWRSIPDSAQ